VKVEMLREGEWVELVPGWRIQSYGGGEFTVRGAYGGFVAPPWRVLDGDGNLIARDLDTVLMPDESVYLIERENQDDDEGNALVEWLAVSLARRLGAAT
jgi:hypothetical protein